MRLLADTHTLIWWLEQDVRLGDRALELLNDEHRNLLLLSAAVVWEISIKQALGKLRVTDSFLELLLEAGVVPLPISHAHAQAAGSLPPHHRDPFDRMLIAQAQLEDAVLITADSAFAPYAVRVAW